MTSQIKLFGKMFMLAFLLLTLSKAPATLRNENYISIVGNKAGQALSGEKIYKTQCAFCHTKEELIAPDMNKIKAAYLKKYKTKEAFVKAVTKFVENPDKKNAIYKAGIDNFTDMPKMPFKEAQIKAVANYIYETANF